MSVAIVISVVVIPFFQPRFNLPPEQHESENTQVATTGNISNGTTVSVTVPTTIDILSSTSAFPFVQRWIVQYENQQFASFSDVNVDYLTDAEIIAAEGKNSRNDLAIVGITKENNNNTLYVPVSAQAVAIVYNIPSFPDIPTGLRLNSTMLSLILNGSINEWDDAAIKQVNPNLNLPDERIVVVHSADNNTHDSSSSSQLLNQYLDSQSLRWPKNDSIITSGPAELAEMVRKIPYSIGYVDFSYAVQTRMTYAAIGNANGDYIVPSTYSIDKAVDIALQFHNSSTDLTAPQQQQLPPTINASRIVGDAYPIVGLYYVSLFASNGDKEEDEIRRNAAILDLVEWITSESGGQQTLLEVQYPSIYSDNEQLVAYAKITMDTFHNSN